MSGRYFRFAKEWADRYVRPGEGADIESYAARARRLAQACAVAGAAAGFDAIEINAETDRVVALMLATVTQPTLHGGDDLDDDYDD